MQNIVIPPPPPPWKNWEELMQLAISEAERGKSLGEVPVGAVIISQNGEIIGTGHNSPINEQNAAAHAEIMAIKAAGLATKNYRLEGAYIVVTLEPCMMCAGAIIHARLEGIVFGAFDSKTGALKSQMNALLLPFHNHIPFCVGGILEQKCSQMLSSFFEEKRKI